MQTVLIIDEQAPLERSLRTALEHGGYRVFEAPSAEAGMRILRQSFHGRPPHGCQGLMGTSDALRAFEAAVQRVGASGASRVLVVGESGSGKALVARALHASSHRAAGPYIELNCASLPADRAEAELFGELGEGVGNPQAAAGLVAQAERGTLFLDEVAELPWGVQAKLLHFLEHGRYRPVGSGQSVAADVRVVASTHRDLPREVAAGRFREDLYYRLNGISLRVPPLRERPSDVIQLALHFAQASAREEHVDPVWLSAAASECLVGYAWPGNVRELKNLIAGLTILHPGREISVAELPTEITMSNALDVTSGAKVGGAAVPIVHALADTERAIIARALRESGGRKGVAADLLGISRHAFKRRIQRLGLS